MQNIMFTEPNPAKILDGTKTMTARNWKRKPPTTGALCTASTGYAKTTRFAIIRILNVWEWDGDNNGINAEEVIGLSKQEIGKREGFRGRPHDPDDWLTDWDDFIMAYYGHNAQNFLDNDRKHYFIEFELVKAIEEGDHHQMRLFDTKEVANP